MSRTQLSVLFGSVALLAAAVPVQAQERWLDYQTNVGAEIGRGWNSHRVAVTNASCVVFAPAESQKGQAKRINLTHITDKYQLQQALSVSAEISVKSFGVSGSGKASFANDVKMTGTSSTFAVHAVVDNGATFATAVPKERAPAVAQQLRQAPQAMTTENAPYRPPAIEAIARQDRDLDPKRLGDQMARSVPELTSTKLNERDGAFSLSNLSAQTNPRKAGRVAPRAPGTAPATAPLTSGQAPIPPPPATAAATSYRTSAQRTADPNYSPVSQFPGSIVLDKPYEEMARTNPRQFRRTCGDSFVSVISHGAELVAVVSFQTGSREEQKKIEAEAKGSGWGVEAKASFQQSVKSFSDNSRLTLKAQETGGTGGSIPSDLNGVNRAIDALAGKAASAPWKYKFQVTRYDDLVNYPDEADFMNIDVDAFEAFAREYGKWQTLGEDLDHILANTYTEQTVARRDAYLIQRSAPRSELVTMQGTVADKVSKLTQVARQCLGANAANSQTEKNGCAVPSDVVGTDMKMRARLPLPLGNPSVPVEAFLSEADYKAQVYETWLQRVNAARCAIDGRDRTFCLSTGTIEGEKSNIPARSLVMQLRGVADWCLIMHNDANNRRALNGSCTASDRRSEWTYDPKTRVIKSASIQDGSVLRGFCLYPAAATARVINGVPVLGTANCNIETVAAWTFEPSGTPGKVLIRNSSSGRCLDVGDADRRENKFTQVWDCIQKAEFMEWAIILK